GLGGTRRWCRSPGPGAPPCPGRGAARWPGARRAPGRGRMTSDCEPSCGRVNLLVSSCVEPGGMNEIGVRVEPPAVTPAARDFDDAYPALFRDAYRVAFRLLGDREDAADAAQEACARACLRSRRLTP